MDITQQQELSRLCDEQIKLAKEYKDARQKAVKAQNELDILLVASLKQIRSEKSNVGYEMSIRMLMENNTVAQKIFEDYRNAEATYKGLEKIVEALQNKVSALQSVMKYTLKGEKYGAY